jgi:hypothetical protein
MDGGGIIWGVDPEVFGLPAEELVAHYCLPGRADGRCRGNKCVSESAGFARRYARADKRYGDRPGRAYWLGFARSRRATTFGPMTAASG